jgi:hypothetical protein
VPPYLLSCSATQSHEYRSSSSQMSHLLDALLTRLSMESHATQDASFLQTTAAARPKPSPSASIHTRPLHPAANPVPETRHSHLSGSTLFAMSTSTPLFSSPVQRIPREDLRGKGENSISGMQQVWQATIARIMEERIVRECSTSKTCGCPCRFDNVHLESVAVGRSTHSTELRTRRETTNSQEFT